MSAALVADRRFWPLFWTQFLGAFNDNLFKNALVLLITFKGIQVFGLPSEQAVALAAAIFILPFFLFSATAGQIADRFDKASVIRATKLAEIGAEFCFTPDNAVQHAVQLADVTPFGSRDKKCFTCAFSAGSSS